VARAAAAAFQHFKPHVHGLLIELPFAPPTARQVAQTVTFPLWEIPCSRLSALEHHGRVGAIFDGGVSAHDAGLWPYRVMQMDEQWTLNVFDRYRQRSARNVMANIMEKHIAIPIGKTHLQAGLHVEPSAPSGILLWRRGRG
jgi:hypothetical protein